MSFANTLHTDNYIFVGDYEYVSHKILGCSLLVITDIMFQLIVLSTHRCGQLQISKMIIILSSEY